MPSMDGPGNCNMWRHFIGDKTGKWKINGNTVVEVGDRIRTIRLHNSNIARWDAERRTLELCAWGYATPTTMRKLQYISEQLHVDFDVPMRMNWAVRNGHVNLMLWDTAGSGAWHARQLPTDSWSVWVQNIDIRHGGNLNAQLDDRTAALFLPAPQPLPIFKLLTFNQMKGVL